MPDPVISLPVSGGISGLGQDAAGLNNILNLLFGQQQDTNNSGGTVTDETIVDPAAIDYVLRTMLEGNGSTNGLASIFTGQKSAGGYGGSTAGLMTSDLISRIVGEVAKLTATKVRTNSPTSSSTSTPGRAAQAAGAAGAGSAIKALNDALKKKPPEKAAKPGGDNASKTPTDGVDPYDLPSTVGEIGDGSYLSGAFGDNLESAFEFDLPIDENLSQSDMEGMINLDDLPEVIYDGQEEENIDGDALALDGLYGGDDEEGDGSEDEAPTDEDGGNEAPPDEDGGDYGGDGDDGGCFITTAVMETMKKPDDCPELQILRMYRDSWLQENHPEGIKMYYDTAPQLVEKIKARPDAKEVFQGLYYKYLIPAIGAILLGNQVEAYNKYRAMVVYVQRIAPVQVA